MDTNLSQAIKIAGGVLIAVVIMTGLAYFFQSLSPVQTGLEDIKALEQTEAFNKEFEVYKKDLMYGVDVISVLNKAASINKAYLDENGEYREELDDYLIDIELIGQINLVQTIELYHIENDGIHVIETSINCADITDDDIRDEICEQLKITEPDEEFHDILNLPDGVMNGVHLIDKTENYDPDSNTEDCITNILKTNIIDASIDSPKRIAKNEDEGTSNIWSRATLETYVYDFKTKKFRCTGITYSDITGRVTSLTFTLVP